MTAATLEGESNGGGWIGTDATEPVGPSEETSVSRGEVGAPSVAIRCAGDGALAVGADVSLEIAPPAAGPEIDTEASNGGMGKSFASEDSPSPGRSNAQPRIATSANAKAVRDVANWTKRAVMVGPTG